MNGSFGNSNFIVRLRGLPWNTTHSEVQSFLQGCKIRQTNFVTNEQGRATGECFVVLESLEDVDNAKTFHQNTLGNRYIEVFESNADEMTQTTKNNTNTNTSMNNNSSTHSNTESNSSSSNTDPWREPVVRLRGLPYNSSKDDVIRFFDGLDIAQNGVHISSSKPAGEAFVAFVNMDNALRALEFNRMNMGHRYIEVFKSTYAEARASIVNDTQSVARHRGNSGSNQNYGNQRQGNYGAYSGNMSSSGGQGGFNNTSNNPNNNNNNTNNNSMNQYNGPPPNNYNYGGQGNPDYNYPMNNQMGSGTSGLKRPMSTSFTMKIRGVPFEAGEKEVFEFFSPVVPIRLEQENTPRGKPPIWYAEFGSREEATEALTFHKKYMGSRYIELLPLYDDGNRPKMVRT